MANGDEKAPITALALNHLEFVQALHDEHEVAKSNIADLRAENARLTAMTEMQAAEIERTRARCHYYEQFSVALTTKLYVIGDMIDGAIREAREKGHVVPATPLAAEDERQLAAIAKALAPEKDEGEAAA